MTIDQAVSDLPPEDNLGEALIAHCKLAVGDVERITSTMRDTGKSFVSAALELGLVTATDVEDTIAWVRGKVSRERPSVFESAIGKLVVRRRSAVQEGPQVTAGPNLILAHDPNHPRSERLRALRTELLLLNEGTAGTGRAFALLSSGSAEGRSQLAAELSVSLSQLGRRTLLIDADLRNPRQHALFGSNNLYGLSQALASADPPMLHSVHGLPNLSLMTSGPIPNNPLELLADGRFARMIGNLGTLFDFIILDTPPVSMYADGLAVAMIASRVLVISRAKHTTFSDTRKLLRRVATTRAQVMGAIINHF